MTTPPPLRVLLIGHGKFGREHRIVWQQLVQEGLATLAGIVVRTETSRRALAATTDIPVHTSLAAIDFAQIDAVDIVTPSETHAALVRQLLPHAHVLVEKPLATTAEEAASLAAFAEASPNILAVAHIYRFHPLITARHYLPGLRDARYIGSRYGTRVVNARQQDIDRPAAPTTTGRIASAGELWRDSSPFGARRR